MELLKLFALIVIASGIGVTAVFYIAIKLGWLPGVEFPKFGKLSVDKKDK